MKPASRLQCLFVTYLLLFFVLDSRGIVVADEIVPPANEVDEWGFSTKPIAVRQAKLHAILKERSGREFVYTVADAIARDCLADWSLELQLDYLKAVLQKEDADFSEELFPSPIRMHGSSATIRSAVVKAAEKSGVKIENMGELTENLGNLEKLGEREKFLKLISQAKAALSGKPVEVISSGQGATGSTVANPEKSPKNFQTPVFERPNAERTEEPTNTLPVWMWISGGGFVLLLLTWAFLAHKKQGHK